MKFTSLLICLFLLSACSTKPYIVKQSDISVNSSQIIYVVNHGWHTGFVIPANIIQQRLPQLSNRFGHTPFIEFGWGDRGFYQANEITSGITLQAIFWPTESVVHVVAIPEPADRYFPESQSTSLCLNQSQYALLIQFIENSFNKDASDKLIPLSSGIYGNSQFYQGEGDYYLMNTCNKWTAKGLRSAGFNISTTFKLTAASIMDYLSDPDNINFTHVNSCIEIEQ